MADRTNKQFAKDIAIVAALYPVVFTGILVITVITQSLAIYRRYRQARIKIEAASEPGDEAW